MSKLDLNDLNLKELGLSQLDENELENKNGGFTLLLAKLILEWAIEGQYSGTMSAMECAKHMGGTPNAVTICKISDVYAISRVRQITDGTVNFVRF